MKNGYRAIGEALGNPEAGERFYNYTQLGIGAFSIARGITAFPSRSVQVSYSSRYFYIVPPKGREITWTISGRYIKIDIWSENFQSFVKSYQFEKDIIKKRYKYYIAAYILGYLASLINTGAPDIYYLVSVKLSGFLLMMTAGNILYYVVEEQEHFLFATARTMKYFFVSIVILILAVELQKYLLLHGIDISPYVDFDRPR